MAEGGPKLTTFECTTTRSCEITLMGDHSDQSGLAWSPMMGGTAKSLEDQKDVGGSMQLF